MRKNTEKAWDALRELTDPELPFLTLNDLGVIRDIKIRRDNYIVTIAPTYIGCPALSVIEDRITSELKKVGIDASIEKSFSPPWSSDWISESGRKKMEEFGISPPLLKDRRSSGDAVSKKSNALNVYLLRLKSIRIWFDGMQVVIQMLDCKEHLIILSVFK